MTIRGGLLEIFRWIIFLDFRYGWPRIHKTQAAFVALHDFKKFSGKETAVGHFINESVPTGSAQVTGDSLHGRGLYISVFKCVHPTDGRGANQFSMRALACPSLLSPAP